MNETTEAWILGGIGAVKGVYAEIGTKERAVMALGAFVLAHDVLCRDGETISEWFDESLEKHPLATAVAGAVVVGHVFNIVPERFDLIHKVATWVR